MAGTATEVVSRTGPYWASAVAPPWWSLDWVVAGAVAVVVVFGEVEGEGDGVEHGARQEEGRR